MSKSIWDKLGSYEIKPSDIILRGYDECPSSPIGLYPSMPVKLVGKDVLIDIEVLDAQLDYNILLGLSNMYEMLTITSFVFIIMMFPHDGKIITMNKLTSYEKETLPTPDGVFPLVSSSHEVITTYTKLNTG